MVKYLICAVMALLVGGCAPVSAARALTNPPVSVQAGSAVIQRQEAPREIDPWLSSLWFDMSMGSQLVDIYNEYAGAQDIARADHVSLVDLLDKVETGRRLVVFKNAADVEELVPRLADKFDIIGYN